MLPGFLGKWNLNVLKMADMVNLNCGSKSRLHIQSSWSLGLHVRGKCVKNLRSEVGKRTARVGRGILDAPCSGWYEFTKTW